MIFQNFDILLTVYCFLELQLRTAVIQVQVKFLHRRNRIVSTLFHLLREEVGENVKVG